MLYGFVMFPFYFTDYEMNECCIMSETSLVSEKHIEEVIWGISYMFSWENMCIF